MAKKPKKRLTQAEEFEILKLVLDKFLWLGFGIMAFGLYNIFKADIATGIMWMIVGAALLVIFMYVIVKEYEIVS
jgi:hypothetical protein